MGAAVDLLEAGREDQDAHEHLARECPWFRHVGDGGADDVQTHCQPAWPGGRAPGEPPRLVVKLTPRTPEASTVHEPTVPPGGPGLFHVKGLQLPAYVQHLYKHLVGRYGKHGAYRVAVGVVKKWAQGVHPGGKPGKDGKQGRVHPDVQAAAQRNVAEWESDKSEAHEHDKAAASAVQLAVWTAPGASPVSMMPGVKQVPISPAGPRGPVVPKVPMPTAAEVRELVSQVPECRTDASLSRSARKHLETAAVKLDKDAVLEALALLRVTQSDIVAAHKADLGPDTAAVFIRVPSEQEIAGGRNRTMAWRALEQKVAGLADRIRKNHFHGIYSGPSNPVRLGTEDSMSATERLIALARGAPSARDVSEPVTADASGATPVLKPGDARLDVTGEHATRELSGLAAVDKVRVNAYLGRARQMQRTNPGGAAQLLAHASSVAREAGAHHLARELHLLIQVLTSTRADTDTKSTELETPGHRDSPDAPHGASMRLAARLK